MPRTYPLEKLREVAEARTDNAAVNLGTVVQHLGRQEMKLAVLLKYREEYQQRLIDAKRRGLDGLALRNFHDFLERLELALVEQRATVAHAKRAVDRSREEWQELERRSNGYATLSQRFDSAERAKAARAEQKQQDDHAARTAARKWQLCY